MCFLLVLWFPRIFIIVIVIIVIVFIIVQPAAFHGSDLLKWKFFIFDMAANSPTSLFITYAQARLALTSLVLIVDTVIIADPVKSIAQIYGWYTQFMYSLHDFSARFYVPLKKNQSKLQTKCLLLIAGCLVPASKTWARTIGVLQIISTAV